MSLIIFTFFCSTVLYGFLLWLAWRRLMSNPQAVKAFFDHVLPLLERKTPSNEAEDEA